jgi:hypothetical protein
LTLTGLYNVLQALREGRPLNAKEKTIHTHGLVGVLRELHDELDAAVRAAYGLSAQASTEDTLAHLVALNAQRAAEEAAGRVRWLRPAFQNPAAPRQTRFRYQNKEQETTTACDLRPICSKRPRKPTQRPALAATCPNRCRAELQPAPLTLSGCKYFRPALEKKVCPDPRHPGRWAGGGKRWRGI